MTDKSVRPREVLSLAAVAMAVCCALPVVIATGAGVTILGLSVGSGLAVLAGLVVVGLGLLRWRQWRACRSAANPEKPAR